MRHLERAATSYRARLPLAFCILLLLCLATLLGDRMPASSAPALAQATGTTASGALPLGGCGPIAVGEGPIGLSPEDTPDKPTMVNIQVDLESAADEAYVFAILDALEERGWNATVFVTGEYARAHTETLQTIQQVRGHQLGVHGEQSGEDLSQMSADEQRTRLNAAFNAIRNLHGYPCADFRPQGLKQNITTYEILQEIEARSNTALVAGPGVSARPYHTSYGFAIIPISTLFDEAYPEGAPLTDEHIFDVRGATADQFYDILRRKFDQNSIDKEPIVMVIHAGRVGGDAARLAAFIRFLDHVKDNQGQVVLTDVIAAMANPYIGFLRLQVPPYAAPGETVTITYTFSVLMYCPTYYFRFYGRYPGDGEWNQRGQDHWYSSTGTWVDTAQIVIPTLPLGVEKDIYTVRTTARACHSSYNCWPTAYSYEKQANATIRIIKGIKGKVEYAGDTVNPKDAMKSLKVEYLENNVTKHVAWTQWDGTYQIPSDKLTNGATGKLRFHLIHSILSKDDDREFVVHADDQAQPFYKEHNLGVINVTQGYEVNQTFAGDIAECGSCYYTLQQVYRFWLTKSLAHTGVIKVECGDNDYANATSYMQGDFMSMWHRHITNHTDRGANIIAHEYGHRVSQPWGIPYGPGDAAGTLPENGVDENWANYAALWSLNNWIEYYNGGSYNFTTQTFTLTGDPGWAWSMADAWLDLNLTAPNEPHSKTQQTLASAKPNTIRKFYEGYVKAKPVSYTALVQNVFTNHGYNVSTWPVTVALALSIGFPLDEPPVITFSGSYADRGVDSNADGRYESLAIDIGLASASTGTHNVSAGLYDAGGSPIIYAGSIQTLTLGVQTATITYDGPTINASGQNGPYHLNDIYVQRSSPAKPDVGEIVGNLSASGGVYTTAAYTYTIFQVAAAAFTGTLSDAGVDTDSNSRYDYLRLSAPVEVRQAGVYQATASLDSADGVHLGDAATAPVTLSSGVGALSFDFDGELINHSGQNGPYIVSNLAIYDASWGVVSQRGQPYTTSAYTYGQFDEWPKAELSIYTAGIITLPTAPRADDEVMFMIPISNTGVATAPEVAVQFVVTGSYYSQVQTLSLPAGGADTAVFTWMAQTGYHTFTVAVDPDNVVSETNETNNVFTWMARIGLPDFSVAALSVVSAPLATIISGTVINQGTMPITNYLDVGVYVDGSLVATKTVNLLDIPYEFMAYMWWVEVDTPILTGAHTVSMTADYPNAFLETDESNNWLTQVFTLTHGPTTDTFGYVATPSGIVGGPTFNWIDIISTGMPITSWYAYGGDVGPIPIGFEFPFYGAAYTTTYASTEGYLSFISHGGNTPADSSDYYRLPNQYQPTRAILFLGCEGFVGAGHAYYQQLSDPTRFVVLYDRLNCYDTASDEYRDYVMELVLYPSGNILMQYQTVNIEKAWVIGMQNHQATYGLHLGQYVNDGQAVLITAPPQPQTDIAVLDMGIRNVEPLSYVVTATLVNYGIMPPVLQVGARLEGSLIELTRTDSITDLAFGPPPFTWTTSIAAPVLSGAYTATVTADPANLAVESNEANNALSRTLTTSFSPITDTYHYIAMPSGVAGGPTYNWTNISGTATAIPITAWHYFYYGYRYSDYYDGFTGIPLGFGFPFYGNVYTTVFPNANGFLTFITGTTNSPSSYYQLPHVYQPTNAIIPFGRDMYVEPGVTTVHYQVLTDPTRFVIMYHQLSSESYPYEPVTYEVILYPNGDVVFQYQSLGGGIQPDVVGMQNTAANKGLWLGRRAYDELAIAISYPLPADINLDPAAVEATLAAGESTVRTIAVENLGAGTLEFAIGGNISQAGTGLSLALVEELAALEKGAPERMALSPAVLASGGPDAYGHVWKDSDASGGPTYSWVEISATGAAVGIYGDDNYGSLPLGFGFSFYGNVYTAAFASTNGLLAFGAGSSSYSNQPIPNTSSPQNFVAPFWDDLYVASSSYLCYQTLGSAPNRRLVVEWNGVKRLSDASGSRTLTFEVILEETTNRILVQYKTMTGTLDSASIGIENSDGADGLQVAYNQSYVHDNLAVEFRPGWLQVSPLAGVVAPGGSLPVNLTMNAAGLATGTYTATLTFDTNDLDEDPVIVPVTLTVSGAVEAPSGGFVVGAVDMQGRSNDGGATVHLGGAYSTTTAASGAFAFSYVPTGTYTATASRDGYLYATHSAIAVSHGATATLSAVRLLGGDADHDADIDIYDLTLLGASFGSAGGAADINGDGAVNVFDLAIVGANFGRAGPTPWP